MVTVYAEGLEAERDALIQARDTERQSWSELADAMNRKSDNDDKRISALEELNSNLTEQNTLLKKQAQAAKHNGWLRAGAALIIGGIIGAIAAR